MSAPVRLNKHLAHMLGISRREADQRIEQGRVFINGKKASLGNVIQPERDSITLDDSAVSTQPKRYTYILMNKPIGYICSRKQQGDTPTIYKLLPHHYQHLKVAGRLDKDSSGLLLLTDDGDTIFKLTHPKFGKEKVYEVGLNKPLTSEDLEKINKGIILEDGVSDLRVTPIKPRADGLQIPNLYKVTMHEGRNRQIRRTFGGLRYMVTHLERTKFGNYTLKQLTDNIYLQI
jgi:23S rRNA pseudouridine2605 synthase